LILPISSTPESQHDLDLFGASNPVSTRSDGSEGSDGALGRAAQGTLLIDGIDCLEQGVRARLVQAIQAGGYARPGLPDPIPVTARVIATAENSEEAWLDGLPIQTVAVESLEWRQEDILPLCAHFLAEFADEHGVEPIGFTTDARNWLVEERWEGNVRELRERIRQAVRLCNNGAISAEALMLAIDGEEVPSFKQAKRAFETRYVEGLLRRCGGNISRAARLAKKDRKDFYDVIRRTGVDPSQFRS